MKVEVLAGPGSSAALGGPFPPLPAPEVVGFLGRFGCGRVPTSLFAGFPSAWLLFRVSSD